MSHEIDEMAKVYAIMRIRGPNTEVHNIAT